MCLGFCRARGELSAAIAHPELSGAWMLLKFTEPGIVRLQISVPVAGAGTKIDPAPGVRRGCKDLSGSGSLLVGVCRFLWHLLISRHRPSGPNRRRNRVSRHRRSGLRLGLGAKAAQGLRRSSRSDSCEAAATWANGPKERRRRRRARNPRARAL